MTIISLLLTELDQEAITTRKILQLVPMDKFDWKPHEKSMSLKQLTVHIAELPSWIYLALTTEELDFAGNPYEPAPVSNSIELMELLEKSLTQGRSSLSNAIEQDLLPTWTVRSGEQIFAVMSKYEVIRHSLNQVIHHRAQLGVYLRLLNIPIPGSYGPSADEMNL